MAQESGYHPDIRVRINGDKPFFGPGTAQLLQCIQDCGSVSAACERMQLSYSKGRIMLRRIEEALGCTVVQCTKGGAGGGGATVTPAGERLLDAYSRYEAMIRHYAQCNFDIMREVL